MTRARAAAISARALGAGWLHTTAAALDELSRPTGYEQSRAGVDLESGSRPMASRAASRATPATVSMIAQLAVQ